VEREAAPYLLTPQPSWYSTSDRDEAMLAGFGDWSDDSQDPHISPVQRNGVSGATVSYIMGAIPTALPLSGIVRLEATLD
jgi:hypothetical protein